MIKYELRSYVIKEEERRTGIRRGEVLRGVEAVKEVERQGV